MLNYTYDSLNRLIGSSQLDADGNVVQRTEHQYDDANRLSKQSWQFDDKTYSETYVYNEDGTLKRVQNSNPINYSFEYDSLSRVSAQSNYYFKQNYSYHVNETAEGDYATPLVSKVSFTDTNEHTQFADFELEYEYDALGNITSIGDSRSGITTYTYDEQGQLLKEDRAGEVYAYSYDTYGNIRSRTDPDGTVHEYEYGNTQWLDLLTKYDGHTITYDEIGNPLSYNNGKRWWNFRWGNRRQLTRADCVDGTVYYTYDLNGIRNSKTVGSITYNYITQNGKVVRQTWKEGNTDYVLDIIYDSNGRPYSCYYQGKCYLYVCNLQGDVIRIVSAYNSTTFVEYTYDAWGNVLSVEGSLASTLGQHNPIRYRGYYYDAETGFYYLQSRYYDPSIGRFINADNYASTGQGFLGYNMFAYCLNSPVALVDEDGRNAAANWLNYMWWLPCIDWGLPIGDLLYFGGAIVLGWEMLSLGVEIIVAAEGATATVYQESEHVSGARNSTKGKHEKGRARNKRDKGGEKGDNRRTNYRENKKKARMLLFVVGDLFVEETEVVEVMNETQSTSGSGSTHHAPGNPSKNIQCSLLM